MPLQPFGRATSLNPGITIAGELYTLAFHFQPHLTNRPPDASASIVSGIAESSTLISANVYDIKCGRGIQPSSYTGGDPGDRHEIPYDCLCGGNIAATHERQRILSYNNPMAYRGGDRRNRAEPGDVLAWTVDGVTRYALILQVEAYGIPQSHVAYQGGAGPGRPPRTFNQPKFATMSSADGVATTDVTENISNAHDRLRVRTEHGETIPANATFNILRNPFAHPDDPPTIQLDLRNGDTDFLDLIEDDDYLAYWIPGLILLKQTTLDNLGITDTNRICLHPIGKLFRQSGQHHDHYNHLATALNQTDTAYLPLGLSGATAAISGYAQGHGITATAFECDGTDAYMAAAAIGRTRESCFADTELMLSLDVTYPFWHRGDDGSTMWINNIGENPLIFTNADYNHDHSCGTSSWNDKFIRTTSRIITVFPFQDDSSGYYHIGAAVDADAYGNLIHGSSAFSLHGITFDATATTFIQNCPVGTVCVHAYLRARFNGLQHNTWTLQQYQRGPVGGTTTDYISTYTWNGTTVARYEIAGGITIENTDNSGTIPKYITSGPIAFQLLARRINSAQIYCPLAAGPDGPGLIVDAPADEWQSFGGGIAIGGTATDGAYTLHDVTNAINAMLQNRNSLYRDFQLWPSLAGVDPGDSAADMSSLATSFIPNQAVTFEISHPSGVRTATITYTASGQHIKFTSVDIDGADALVACFRYPSGILETVPLPLHQPAIIGALE